MGGFRGLAFRFSLLFLILIGGGIGLFGWLAQWAQARVGEELGRLEERGGSLHLSDLIPPPLPDEENGILLFKEAGISFVEAEEEDRAALSALRNDPAGASREDAERVKQWLEKNRTCMALLETGHEKPGFRVNVDYTAPLHLDTFIQEFFTWPSLLFCRSAAHLLTAEALLHARAGDSREAFESCRRAIRLGRTMNAVPTLISHMVFMACESIALETLKRILKDLRPFPEDGGRLLEELAALDPSESMARALEGELCFIHAAYEYVKQGGLSGTWMFEEEAEESGLFSSIFRRPRCLLDLEHAWHLEEMGRYIAALRSHDPLLRACGIKREVPWYCLVLGFITEHSHMNDSFLDQIRALQANSHLAGLALRLIRFSERHSRLPVNLEELAPDPIPCTDPFGGDPFVYERLEDGGFLLYSVGFNRKDDDGEESPYWDKGDIVWTWRAAGSSCRDAR